MPVSSSITGPASATFGLPAPTTSGSGFDTAMNNIVQLSRNRPVIAAAGMTTEQTQYSGLLAGTAQDLQAMAQKGQPAENMVGNAKEICEALKSGATLSPADASTLGRGLTGTLQALHTPALGYAQGPVIPPLQSLVEGYAHQALTRLGAAGGDSQVS